MFEVIGEQWSTGPEGVGFVVVRHECESLSNSYNESFDTSRSSTVPNRAIFCFVVVEFAKLFAGEALVEVDGPRNVLETNESFEAFNYVCG